LFGKDRQNRTPEDPRGARSSGEPLIESPSSSSTTRKQRNTAARAQNRQNPQAGADTIILADLPDEDTIVRAASSGKDLKKFQKRLQKGKIRICPECGEIMGKANRMVLSPVSGFILIVLGVAHMVLYGVVTNYLQAPWSLKFALPAVYYVGSIFIGVGVVFFFIRERVWVCKRCGVVSKR
jgi:hypothetical protein